MLGFDISAPSSLPMLPTEEIEQTSLIVHPWVGANWENLSIRSSIQTNQNFQQTQLGTNEYTTQIGITEITLDALPVWYKKDKNVAFFQLGGFVHIPNIDISSAAQSEDDTDLLEQQLHTDFFSCGGRLGLGARKMFSSLFLEARINQKITWNPIFSDEFGTEQHYSLQSEVRVTFGWLL